MLGDTSTRGFVLCKDSDQSWLGPFSNQTKWNPRGSRVRCDSRGPWMTLWTVLWHIPQDVRTMTPSQHLYSHFQFPKNFHRAVFILLAIWWQYWRKYSYCKARNLRDGSVARSHLIGILGTEGPSFLTPNSSLSYTSLKVYIFDVLKTEPFEIFSYSPEKFSGLFIQNYIACWNSKQT